MSLRAGQQRLQLDAKCTGVLAHQGRAMEMQIYYAGHRLHTPFPTRLARVSEQW